MKHSTTPTLPPKSDREPLKIRTKIRAGITWSDATGHFDFRKGFLPTIPNE